MGPSGPGGPTGPSGPSEPNLMLMMVPFPISFLIFATCSQNWLI
jgi:hypothetical protein